MIHVTDGFSDHNYGLVFMDLRSIPLAFLIEIIRFNYMFPKNMREILLIHSTETIVLNYQKKILEFAYRFEHRNCTAEQILEKFSQQFITKFQKHEFYIK